MSIEGLVESRPAPRRSGTIAAVLWAGAEGWGQQLFSFGVFIVLARLVDPTAFGVVALAGLFLSFCRIVVDSGLGAGIIRLRDVESKHLASAFWLALGLAMVLATATVVVAPLLSRWTGATELTPVLQILALLLPLAALTSVPSAILTRQLRFDTLTKRTIAGVTVGGIAGVLAAVLHAGVWSLVIQQLAAATIGALLLWTSVQWRPTAELGMRHMRDIATIGLAVVANSVAWFVCQRADQAVLGAAMGARELALYAMGMKLIMTIIDLVCSPIGRAALPILSEQQDDGVAFERIYVRLTTAAAAIAVPILVGSSLVAPEGLTAGLGERWGPSAMVVRLLLGYGLVTVLFTTYDPAMIAKARTRLYLLMLVSGAVTTPVASLIGVRWGLAGVAMAVTINHVLHGVVGIFALQISLRVRVISLVTSVWPVFAASGCMAAVVTLWRLVAPTSTAPWPTLLVSIVLGAAAYTGAMSVLAPKLMAELKQRIRVAADFRLAPPRGGR